MFLALHYVLPQGYYFIVLIKSITLQVKKIRCHFFLYNIFCQFVVKPGPLKITQSEFNTSVMVFTPKLFHVVQGIKNLFFIDIQRLIFIPRMKLNMTNILQ